MAQVVQQQQPDGSSDHPGLEGGGHEGGASKNAGRKAAPKQQEPGADNLSAANQAKEKVTGSDPASSGSIDASNSTIKALRKKAQAGSVGTNIEVPLAGQMLTCRPLKDGTFMLSSSGFGGQLMKSLMKSLEKDTSRTSIAKRFEKLEFPIFLAFQEKAKGPIVAEPLQIAAIEAKPVKVGDVLKFLVTKALDPKGNDLLAGYKTSITPVGTRLKDDLSGEIEVAWNGSEYSVESESKSPVFAKLAEIMGARNQRSVAFQFSEGSDVQLVVLNKTDLSGKPAKVPLTMVHLKRDIEYIVAQTREDFPITIQDWTVIPANTKGADKKPVPLLKS